MRLVRSRQPRWKRGLAIGGGVLVTGLILQALKSSSPPVVARKPGSDGIVKEMDGDASKDAADKDLASDDAAADADSDVNKKAIADQLGAAIRANTFPQTIDFKVAGSFGGPKKVNVHYAIDDKYQDKMEKLIRLYGPDHAAFIAMDARTGRIIAMVSYERENPQNENLTLHATFPVASVFKVVTASAAIDGKKAGTETIIPFNGANHTLYKRNAMDDTRVNRWTQKMTMREAFSRSVNTFFGKLGLFYVGPASLMKYAEKYQFNRSIRADIPIDMGVVKISPDDPWGVVQAASGFTRDSTMSPLHGALIAATVANDGVMMEPYLVDGLSAPDGTAIYKVRARRESVIMSPESAAEIRVLMRETVKNGTSRKSFRSVVRKKQYEDVEMGGKTGSLTGLNPKGKCDWFVGYARYKDQRIAVAALTVNEKKWRVKSSQLASQFLADYTRQLMKDDDDQ